MKQMLPEFGGKARVLSERPYESVTYIAGENLTISIISLQEIILVSLAAFVFITYHANLYTKVRRDPLKTSIGIGNHARRRWIRGIMRDQRDILAVQRLRNQVMAATFLASTAILISLGLLNVAFRPGIFSEISHASIWLEPQAKLYGCSN
jgi:hypothetical protein